MNIIPLIVAQSQNLSILLGGQNCQITVSQKGDYMYLSLAVNNSPIVDNIICRNLVKLVRYTAPAFIGNLAFIDTQGEDDPNYLGLGSRFNLVYLP